MSWSFTVHLMIVTYGPGLLMRVDGHYTSSNGFNKSMHAAIDKHIKHGCRTDGYAIKPLSNHTINRAAFVCLFVCLSVCLFVCLFAYSSEVL